MIERNPTGIFDKHGVEVHTGDIILDPTWWWGARYVYLNRGRCGPCKGDSVMAYILAIDLDDPLKNATHNIWDGGKVEIIGRIDQTPELLGLKPEKPAMTFAFGEWPDVIG